MSFCEKCGQQLRDDAAFCQKCGTPCVIQPQPEPEPAPVTPEPVCPATVPSAAAPQPIRSQMTFVNSWLGIVVMGTLFLIAIILLAVSGNGFSSRNFSNIFRGLLCVIPLALGAALSYRAKGVDLSLGFIMSFSAVVIASAAQSGSTIGGVLLAIVLCTIAGLINGVLINYLRVPAPLITIVSGSLLYGVMMLVTDGMMLQFAGDVEAGMLATLLITLLLLIPAAFLLIFFTRLGKRKSERKRDDRSFLYVLAYVLSAVMACFAGYFMLVRLGAASPTIGNGYEILIIFIAAALRSSRVIDNRFMPVIYALAALFVWRLLENAMNLIAIYAYIQLIIEAVLAGIMLIVAYACRKDLHRIN